MMTRHRLILCGILLTAALLRVRYFADLRFYIDYGYPIWQTLGILDRGNFPLTGQMSSVGFVNPPLTAYLYLPWIALTRSPLGVYIFVIALNTLAVWLTYRLSRRLLGDEAGLAGAWLMAVNPWVVVYSRTAWTQSLTPFLICLLALLVFPIFTGQVKQRDRRTLLAAVLTTVLTQTYLLAFIVVGQLGLLALIFRRRVRWKSAAIGGVIFALAAGLYAVGVLRGGLQSSSLEFVEDNLASSWNTSALQNALRLVTGGGFSSLSPSIQSLPLLEFSTQIIVLGLLLIGVASALVAVLRRTPDRDSAICLLVWWSVPIIALSYTRAETQVHYQTLGLPAGFLLVGWGVRTLLSQAAALKPLLAGVLLLVGVWMGWNATEYAQTLSAEPEVTTLYNIATADGLRLGAAINQHLPPGGTVYAESVDVNLNSLSGRLYPVIHEMRSPRLTIVPANSGLYVGLVPPDLETPLEIPFATHLQTLMLRDGKRVDIARFEPFDDTVVQHRLDLPTDSGLTLIGYDFREARRRWVLTTYWHVESIQPASNFGSFVHLFDTQGERVGIVDGYVVPGRRWQVGDMQIHRMRFEVPPNAAALVFGQYDPNQKRNMAFVFEDGTTQETIRVER